MPETIQLPLAPSDPPVPLFPRRADSFACSACRFAGSGEEEERERKKRRDKKESRRSGRDGRGSDDEEEKRRRKKKSGDRGKDKGRVPLASRACISYCYL